MNGREPYLTAARTLLRESGCVVVKWNTGNYGRAYTRRDEWEIEVPEPRGAKSYATFAHEVGHQMLHRHGSRQRWVEELEAWEYALATFERFTLPGGEQVREDARTFSLYAAAKALRRTKKRKGYVALARRMDETFPEWVGFRDWIAVRADDVFAAA